MSADVWTVLSGYWATGSNWSIGSPPTADEPAVIENGANPITVGNGTSAVAISVTLLDSALAVAGDLTVGTWLYLDSSPLEMTGGTLSVPSILLENEGGSAILGYGTISGAIGGQFAEIEAGSSAGGTDGSANGGVLTIDGPIEGNSGEFLIAYYSTLELGQGTTWPVIFSNGSYSTPEILKLDSPSTFTGPIVGFSDGDTLDLVGIVASSVSLSGSTLTITETNGQKLAYNYFSGSGSILNFASDNHGGTDIYWDARPSPSLFGIFYSPENGDFAAGSTITISLPFSETVTVSGTPQLQLNDGGVATYAGEQAQGPSSVSNIPGSTLNFTYTVAPGDHDVSSLAVDGIDLNGATIEDAAGNAFTVPANLSVVSQVPGPQIDTSSPHVTSISETPSDTYVTVGSTVTITLDWSEPVDVAGAGTPTLALNDGATAIFSGGSGAATEFTYTVSTTDMDVTSLAVTSLNLDGGTIEDGAGNNADLSLPNSSAAGPNVVVNDAGFVQYLYETVLLRPGAAGEIDYWAGQLSQGVTPSQFVADVVNSSEAQTEIVPIVQLYKVLLDRAPDIPGLDFWVAALRGGETLNAIASSFISSPEFQHDGGTNIAPAAFVAALYEQALGRAPDSAGEQFWLNELGTNPTIVGETDVALGILQSAEFQADSIGPIDAWLSSAALTGSYGSTIGYLTPGGDGGVVTVINDGGILGTSAADTIKLLGASSISHDVSAANYHAAL